MGTLRRIFTAAAVVAATAATVTASADAANYYNIVNAQTGQALEVNPSGVRLAPLNRTSYLQQFKRIEIEGQLDWGFFASKIQNRLGQCLIDDVPTTLETLTTGLCDGGTRSSRMWSQMSGEFTGSPSIPGRQLVNDQTAAYVTRFCFITCGATAALVSAEIIAADPQDGGRSAKWHFRFAATGP